MVENPKKDSRGRGRPAVSDRKMIETRIKIEKVARRLFQEQGYGQVSIRKIAKEMSCSPMTLYKYYDSKIAILRTLWGDIFDEVFKRIESNQSANYSPTEYLKVLANDYVAYWLDNTDHYRLVFMAEGVSQNDVSVFVDNPEIAIRYQVFSVAIINAHQGELSIENLQLKSDALICCLHGIAHNKITISGYPWADTEDLVSTVVNGTIIKA